MKFRFIGIFSLLFANSTWALPAGKDIHLRFAFFANRDTSSNFALF